MCIAKGKEYLFSLVSFCTISFLCNDIVQNGSGLHWDFVNILFYYCFFLILPVSFGQCEELKHILTQLKGSNDVDK